MIKLIAIPVGGTIAALIVILLAHGERDKGEEASTPPVDLPPPRSSTPVEEKPTEQTPTRKTEEEKADQYQLRLDQDGSFFDLESEQRYADAEALVAKLGTPRHTLVLTNGEGVDQDALDQAAAALQANYTVRKIYRAPEDKGK